MKHIKKFEKNINSINSSENIFDIAEAPWMYDIEDIKKLINSGIDLNVNLKNRIFATPLMRASTSTFKDSIIFINLLIESGVDLDATNINGDTALHIAANNNNHNQEIIKILTDAGADWNIKNNNGKYFFDRLLDWKNYSGSRPDLEELIRLYPDKSDILKDHYNEYLYMVDLRLTSDKYNL